MKEKKFDINDNAFDIIGLVAAIGVLIGHTIGHSGITVENRIYPVLANFFMPGECVAVIFAISGFLVAASYERTKGAVRFFLKRILKVYPGLILVVVIPSIFYIFAGYIEIDIISYLRYLIRRILFQTRPDLVPDGAIGNASLWTIVMQMQFYLLTPILVKILKKCKLFGGASLIFLFVIYNIMTPTLKIKNMILEFLYYTLCFPYLYMYLIGVLCYLKSDIIVPWLKSKAYLLLICYCVIQCIIRLDFLYEWNYINPFSGVIACLMAIGLSYRIRGRKLTIDPSYGIYLWHMPIMEGIHYLLKVEYSLPIIFITWAGATLAGVLQYLWIERPCQRLLTVKRE